MIALKCRPRRVDNECSEHDEREERLRPPRFAPHRLPEAPSLQRDYHVSHVDESLPIYNEKKKCEVFGPSVKSRYRSAAYDASSDKGKGQGKKDKGKGGSVRGHR